MSGRLINVNETCKNGIFRRILPVSMYIWLGQDFIQYVVRGKNHFCVRVTH